MPETEKRYFIFAQIPRKYLAEFIEKVKKNPKIGRVLDYHKVWFISDGTENYEALPGTRPVGDNKAEEPSVLWIGSCETTDSEDVLKYVSDAHPWEVPMIYGSEFDFPIPTEEEREKKHSRRTRRR